MSGTTGRLGSSNSLFDQIIPGSDETSGLTQQVAHSLGLTDLAVSGSFFEESASSTLSFADLAGLSQAVTVTDTISFSQSSHENIQNVSPSSTLSLTDEAIGVGPFYVEVTQFIPFSDEADFHFGVKNVSVSHGLLFTDLAGRTFAKSVSDSIVFVSAGLRFTGAAHTLSLVDAVAVGRGGDNSSALALSDVATPTLVLNRSLTDPLGFVQAASFYIDSGCLEKRYRPFVGTGDPTYTAPTVTAPTFGSSTLTLTYPYVTPTTTLVLRNPQFGDRNVLTFNRINRETRGGTLIVFADPTWPKIQKLTVTVTGLKQQQADDLQTFLDSSLGDEIGLLDYLNRQWRGIITTPDAEIVENSRNNRGLSFEFEGSLV